MYRPAHAWTYWASGDNIYSEMSPLLNNVENMTVNKGALFYTVRVWKIVML
jgi:hypothetical protein